jgi:NADH dehydrogenase
MKTITIFGGTGFIGSHLIPVLLAKNYRLKLVSREAKLPSKLQQVGTNEQIIQIKASFNDFHSIVEAVTGADIVINLIGILNEQGSQTFESIHIEIIKKLVEACKSQNVKRLIHISALGANIHANSKYLQSKGRAEQIISENFLQYTILKPSLVYGPGDISINSFAQMMLKAPILPLFLNGEAIFQPVYVKDLANAILFSVENNDSISKVYELGGDEIVTMRQLLEKISRYLAKKIYFIPLANWLSEILATIFGLMPNPLITRDTLKNMRVPNQISGNLPGFKEMGITPVNIDGIIPTYVLKQ